MKTIVRFFWKDPKVKNLINLKHDKEVYFAKYWMQKRCTFKRK